MAAQGLNVPTPSYPAGSHHFVKRHRFRAPASTDVHVPGAARELDIAIVGAGVGGLAAAIALKRKGFRVSIYESTPVLSEIGAGIQVPPNSARLLYAWGLKDALEANAVTPRSLIWRRWQNGAAIGCTRLNPEFEQWFGAPYYVIHRAHLHRILHERAVELGVTIHLSSPVAKYDLDQPRFELKSGRTVQADLIIAADGLRSLARQTLMGDGYQAPVSSGYAAYRASVKVADMRANPKTSWIVDTADLNLWVGGHTHAMTYMIAGGTLYNMVMTHSEPSEPDTWDHSDLLPKMKAEYTQWDPSLVALLDMVSSTSKWPIQYIETPSKWSSKSGGLLLLGDAAHATLPNMALGAAMAVEDAAVLAECLSALPSHEPLKTAVDVYEKLRIPRARAVHEAGVIHGRTLHYPDGPMQEARDEAMRPEVEGKHFIDSPNQWSDPSTQLYCYMYDVVAEARDELHRVRGGVEASTH